MHLDIVHTLEGTLLEIQLEELSVLNIDLTKNCNTAIMGEIWEKRVCAHMLGVVYKK